MLLLLARGSLSLARRARPPSSVLALVAGLAVAAPARASSSSSSGRMSKAVATFAGGCFWCVEAPFSELKGVESAVSGYIGGHVRNPNYKDVCGGDTGHAEAVRVTYDPSVRSFEELLDVLFTIHDPTQLNRQGNDVGTQYRSAIFYADAEQRAKAEAYLKRRAKDFRAPIVTTLEPAEPTNAWYPAEEYHQAYCRRNPNQGYVVAVSKPKLNKARAAFPDLMLGK